MTYRAKEMSLAYRREEVANEQGRGLHDVKTTKPDFTADPLCREVRRRSEAGGTATGSARVVEINTEAKTTIPGAGRTAQQMEKASRQMSREVKTLKQQFSGWKK